MFYVAGRIADKGTPPAYGVVERGKRTPWEDAFKDSVAANYGGIVSDYSFFTAADNSTEAVRVVRGDEWVPTWTDNEITALDFSAYDAKKWIRFYASKTSILANDKDLSIISSKIYTANKSEVDTTYSGTIDVIVRSPRNLVPVRFVFSKGLASKNFRTSEFGTWEFPYVTNTTDQFRIDSEYVATVKTIL